jgi:hypothetical protein
MTLFIKLHGLLAALAFQGDSPGLVDAVLGGL